ncbi:MAG: hypothetical protein K6T34_02825 [Thermoflavifilum sp.]|nr:hypothetical protein [Thermoflavifilum sp.]
MTCISEKWHILENIFTKRLGRKPNLEGILMLIGLQEIGSSQKSFSKEEKQDLIHIGTCTVLAQQGFYRFEKKDADGWPYFQQLKPLPQLDAEEQEEWLKSLILDYFAELIIDNMKKN